MKVNESSGGFSHKLLEKCMDLIKLTVSTTKSFNTIEKCLQILKLIIEESEKNGTDGLKSHNGLLKNSKITLKVISTTAHDLTINIYSNTTIFELKEILSRKIYVAIDFLKIKINEHEIQPSDHGKTVRGLGIQNGDILNCCLNGLESKIPQKELVKDGEIVPELIQIVKDWFLRFSTNEKMSREECGKFIRDVTGNRDPIEADDMRVTNLFNKYDEDRDGFLDEAGLLKFYSESTLSRPGIVRDNLKNMNIRNDLKSVSLLINNILVRRLL